MATLCFTLSQPVPGIYDIDVHTHIEEQRVSRVPWLVGLCSGHLQRSRGWFNRDWRGFHPILRKQGRRCPGGRWRHPLEGSRQQRAAAAAGGGGGSSSRWASSLADRRLCRGVACRGLQCPSCFVNTHATHPPSTCTCRCGGAVGAVSGGCDGGDGDGAPVDAQRRRLRCRGRAADVGVYAHCPRPPCGFSWT